MARAKKETALTPEERLQAALVPDWEWPYKLPGNWCWTNLVALSDIKTGKKDANYGCEDGAYYFFTCASEPLRCDGYSFEGKAILLAGNGDIGNISIYDGKFEAYQRTYVVSIHSPLITEYFYHYFKYRWVDYNKDKMFGTAIPYIRLGNLQEFSIPLAPLAEQQQIVDRIENLFAKLDEAKEKAQAVVDSFETRKAAILHKAFTGELTANWRESHGVGMESWEDASFESTIDKMQNGLAKRSGAKGKPYVVLRLANLSADGFNTDDLREILLDEKEQMNYELRPNDVIMVRVNGSKDNVGKQYLVTNQNNWAFCDHLIRIRYSEKVLPQYMTYFAQSEKYRLYVKDNIVSSAGQNTISRKGMANLFVPVPQNNEQLEIVRILDGFFAKEQQAKEAAEAVLDQIDLLKKSILARAFRGELGTNAPTDEPAVKLLKRVLNIPAEQKPVIKRKYIPKELDAQIKTDLERKIIKLYIQNETEILSINQIMNVSSKKFDVLETLRNLQNRGILIKENDLYKLVR